MNADYSICNGWGNRIAWSNPSEFRDGFGEGKTFGVNGHQAVIPKVGQTLLAEFKKSFIKFEFIEVEPCLDPPDMFFATVRPIEQEMKI